MCVRLVFDWVYFSEYFLKMACLMKAWTTNLIGGFQA